MNIKNVVLGLSLLVGVNAFAQSKKWTLKECVSHALTNNITIKNAELDKENAAIAKSDAIGSFLPSFNASASHSWRIGRSEDIVTGTLKDQTTQFSSVGASAGVDIFRGLQNVNRLKRARLNEIAAQYSSDNIKDDVSLNVANAYMQVLFNRENLEIAKAQYAVTEQDLKRTKELVDNGVVPRGNLLDLEATIATQQQQIVNSENGLLLARISLAQLLLIEDYENFDIADESFMIPPSNIMDKTADEIYRKALSFRNDIKLGETNVEMAELDVKLAKGALLPSLRGSYSLGSSVSYADRPIGVDGSGNTILGPHLPIGTQLDNNLGHNISLNLSIPIFNGFSAKNNVKRQKVNLARIENNYIQTKLNLSNTVYQAWNNTTAAHKAHEAATKTVVAREEALKYAKERFNVGLMNSFDYTQAQARVDNAKAEMIRTKYDYIFKLKVLEFYFGIPIHQLN